jgi:hypothetical protein
MSRWTTYLLQALAALGETDPTFDHPAQAEAAEPADDESVRAAFHSIVEREWGPSAFRDGTPPPRDPDR